MLTQEQIDKVQPQIRTIQVVCLALIMGTIMAGAVFATISDWQNVVSDFAPFPLVAVGFAIMSIAMSFIVPQTIFSAALNSLGDTQGEERLQKILSGSQSKTIVRFAILEGAAFLNFIAFYIEQNLLPLGAAAALLGLMIVLFPKRDWILHRIEENL